MDVRGNSGFVISTGLLNSEPRVFGFCPRQLNRYAAIEMPSKSEIQRRKAIVQEIAQRRRAEAEAEMLLLPTLVSSSFKRISIPEIFGRGDLR